MTTWDMTSIEIGEFCFNSLYYAKGIRYDAFHYLMLLLVRKWKTLPENFLKEEIFEKIPDEVLNFFAEVNEYRKTRK